MGSVPSAKPFEILFLLIFNIFEAFAHLTCPLVTYLLNFSQFSGGIERIVVWFEVGGGERCYALCIFWICIFIHGCWLVWKTSLYLQQLVSEKDLIVREEACRVGLLFGGFTGSYHALRCLLRKLRRKETPLNA